MERQPFDSISGSSSIFAIASISSRSAKLRFEHYAGLYVLHCHNLEHEDAGMMLNLEVV